MYCSIFVYVGSSSVLPGELSAKGFRHREVEQELQEVGLRETWNHLED